MPPVTPHVTADVVDAVNRAHAYLVDLFHGSEELDLTVSVEDVGGERDVFLWVREDGATPIPRPPDRTDDIETYPLNGDRRLGIEFQLHVDGAGSEYTVEAVLDLGTGRVTVGDVHVL